jgi:molybdopterin converting factor small subunit
MDEVVIRILFFAKARELVGKDFDNISLSRTTSRITGANLLCIITEQFPALESISKNIVLAADEEYVEFDQLIDIKNCKEIAVIPPLSGG